MKKLLVFSLMILSSIINYTANADIVTKDNIVVVKDSIVSQDTPTEYYYVDKQDVKHQIYITKKGRFYINKKSKKTGKVYKQYLPKDKQEALMLQCNNKK